jgi:hypothetical protein
MPRLESDLPKPFMHAGLAKRRPSMYTNEEVSHCLREVPQRLLLHRLRPRAQPRVFGADYRELRRLLLVTRSATARLPKLLLLHGQVPDEARMPAMLQQHHLLTRCRQQPEPRHTRNLATGTDISSRRTHEQVRIGIFPD